MHIKAISDTSANDVVTKQLYMLSNMHETATVIQALPVNACSYSRDFGYTVSGERCPRHCEQALKR